MTAVPDTKPNSGLSVIQRATETVVLDKTGAISEISTIQRRYEQLDLQLKISMERYLLSGFQGPHLHRIIPFKREHRSAIRRFLESKMALKRKFKFARGLVRAFDIAVTQKTPSHDMDPPIVSQVFSTL